MKQAVQINLSDNVAVALEPLEKGMYILDVYLQEEIPAGHKFALQDISVGEYIVKYGYPIGAAGTNISAGCWVHTHNMHTLLSGEMQYDYSPKTVCKETVEANCFQGYRRTDGKVGIRNEIWIIPTVGCVNDVCRNLEIHADPLRKKYKLDGIFHFPHPYGCSQLGDDLENTKKLLAALCRHPNAGGVLVVGLGCENNVMSEFLAEIGVGYHDKLRAMSCQACVDEEEKGLQLLEELAQYASGFCRETVSFSELVIGMKCGGSDGLSGITANAVVGKLTDALVGMGGTAILTEVPEMFGAEHLLMERAENREVFEHTVEMINDFKNYFLSHGQPVGENPSPGNKEGGITTLEDKSLGCIQKGGQAPVSGVLDYGQSVQTQGLNLLCAPGNDLVSATALAAAGAHMILFTTGRGTPFGAPVPTIKISTNTQLYETKPHWIDFDAGIVVGDKTVSEAAEQLMKKVASVADGEQTCTERNSQRGIAIWKNGVTL